MILRKYGVATTLYFPLIDYGATDFESTPVTFAAGDSQISKDGGAFSNTTNTPSHEGNGIYSLALTATEMQSGNIVITIIDQTATKLWEDQAILIDTYGNGSAQHAMDLDTTVPTVSEIADQVWDELTAGHVGAGSFGEEVASHATSSEISALNDPTAAAIADAVWDELTAGHVGAGSFGEEVTSHATSSEIAALNDPSATDIADAVLSRGVSNVEDGGGFGSKATIGLMILAMFESSVSGTTWSIRKTDGTLLVNKVVTVDASALPITGVT